MSQALIYKVNNRQQAVVATGTSIDFGNIIRRYGCIQGNGDGVHLPCTGYYALDGSFDVLGTAGGTMTIQFYYNGIPIPGASASLTTAADVRNSVTIPAIVRQNCPKNPGAITAIASGVAGTITQATIRLVKE